MSRFRLPPRRFPLPWPSRRRRRLLLLATALAGTGAGLALSVRAADPQPYSVSIGKTGNGALDAAIQASSSLVSLRQKAPVAPFALITRAQQDEGRLVTALRSFGYYDGSVAIQIDGRPLDDPSLPDLLLHTPAGTSVPVVVTPHPGPQFHLRHVTIQGQVPPDVRAQLPPVVPGAPAVASDVLAAQGRMLNQLQEDGHALAQVDAPVAVEYKQQQALDVSYKVDAGPRVDLGPITVTGLKGVNPSYVRNRITLHQGELFQPSKIRQAREDLASLGVFSSVDVQPAPHLDAEGQLPITFALREAPRHIVSIGASYATDLGFQGTVSWTDRNLFGNAEQLKLSASNTQLGGTASRSPGYDVTAAFIKPDFLHRDQALEIDLQAIKESLDAYDRTALTYGALLRRKVSDHWTASLGLAGETERIKQEGETRHYSLIGVPGEAKFDDTDSLLEPTRGVRAAFDVTPTESLALQGGAPDATFVLMQASASTYIDLGAPGRSVLALRGLVGTAQGASLLTLPPDKRFYAGGSGTIRGYRYLSVGPQFPDHRPIGGLAIDAGTVEFRQRILKSFGAAVFVDAGQVGRSSAPFTGTLRVGAGVGARYYTPIGPIRVDFAVPLNKEPGGDSFELYLGLGEAF